MQSKQHNTAGDLAEIFVAELLAKRGYVVENLNNSRRNHPSVDLRCKAGETEFLVSVKSCWAANRQIRLGSPHILERLADDVFLLILMPARKGDVLELVSNGYALLIVPASVAKAEALEAHYHYAQHSPGSAGHSVMIKDKQDRSPHTRSGAVFQSWLEHYTDAWHLLPKPLALA